MEEKKKEELKAYTEEEILDLLDNNLDKEKSLKSLLKLLNISDLALFGYVKKLKEQGISIDYYEKDEDVYFVKNFKPDLTKENVYHEVMDFDKQTKIAFIADLRAGSKSEQFHILNDMYKKFANNGVTHVIIGGNLLEGVYTKKELESFGQNLITNDPISQADHLIEYFPKVEGIKTLFITGKLDHKCSKKVNIGEYIASKRSDMLYLGPVSCNLYFNNVCFRVEQLDKGDAYTVAYPHQKYSRSMSSYQDYDAIFLSGALNLQYFPQIRNTQIFSIPSVTDRTPIMQHKNQMNTIGNLRVNLEYTKTGTLKRLVPIMTSYDEPSKESYLTIKKLNLTKNNQGDYERTEVKKTSSNSYFASLDKLYKLMKKEESFESLRSRLEISENELYGALEVLKQQGQNIEVIDVNNELVIRKSIQRRHDYESKPPKEELHKKKILVVSDTHYGSIFSQPSMVNTACYEAYNRGITDFFHIGDICDGDYSRIRPIHIHEVFLYGATGQLEYTAATLPKYSGVKWHGICGSHDQTHLFNYGMDFGKELAKLRPDFEYLDQDRAIYNLDKCKIEMFHPGGGTSRILSTKPQNGIDQLPSKTKSDLSLRGHYHKVYYMLYRNIQTFLVPCNVDQSSFMMKNELPNLMGDLFLTIYYDDNGRIHYLIPEFMMFDQNDVRKNDWENPKRYIKNKIITPFKK